MANLETLELRISANAEAATRGLGSLISSLGNLSDAIVKPYSDLRDLNAEIKKLKDAGKVKITVDATAAVKQAKSAAKKVKEAVVDMSKNNGRGGDSIHLPDPAKDAEWNRRLKENTAAYMAQREAIRKATIAARERMATENAAAAEAAKTRMREAMSLVNNADAVTLAKTKYEEMAKAYFMNASAGKYNNQQLAEGAQKVIKAREQWEKLAQAQNESATASKSVGSHMKSLKESVSKLFTGFTKLYQNVKRIATRMLIRAAIRGLISSFKEGIKNVYEWSKATGGTFAKAMDEAKSKIAVMKNSLGAALAPLIQALIPLFNQLSSAIVTAANWINQFFALITGQSSWTKAIEGTTELADATTGAAKANKALLASFDELNVIQSEGGGGGGTASQVVDTDMFQQMYTFNEDVKKFVNWIKTSLDSIQDVAEAIAATFLLWKVSEAFEGIIGTIAGWLALGGVIAITLQLGYEFTSEYLNTGDDGWLIADALTSAVGATAAWAIATKIAGGKAGAYAAAITLALSAAVDVAALVGDTDVEALSEESLKVSVENALKLGAAASILSYTTGASIGMALAGGAAVALTAFGVIVGIKATADAIDAEKITKKTIKADVVSALAVGSAGTLLALVGGATAGVAIAGGALIAAAAFTALVTIQAVASLEKPKDIRWGDLELTPEEIQAYVDENMINTANLTVLIDQVNVQFDEKANLEAKIKEDIENINTQLNVLKLGVDIATTHKNIKQLIGDSDSGLIGDITDMCNLNIDSMKLFFGNVSVFDGDGKDITSETVLAGIQGWTKIKDDIELNGQELTKLLYKGATEQLTPEEEAYEQELLANLLGMAERITKAKEFGEATSSFKTAALSEMTKGSVEGVLQAFDEYSSNYEETIRKALTDQISGWYTLADLTDDPDLKAKYVKIADDLSAGFEETVSTELAKETENGRKMIIDWLQEVFTVSQVTDADVIKWRNFLETSGMTSDDFQGAIRQVLMDNGVDAVAINAMDIIGISGWDMLTKDVQDKLLASITISPESVEALKKACNMTAKDIISITKWDEFDAYERDCMIESLLNAFGVDAIKAFKEQMPEMKALDIVYLTDWEGMSKDQQKKFIDAMTTEFGSDATIEAMNEIGADISGYVQKGLDSDQPDIKAQVADIPNETIQNKLVKPVEDTKPTMAVTADWESEKDPRTIFQKAADNLKAKAKIAAQFTWAKKKDMKTVVNDAKDKINKKPPVISGKYDYLKGSKPEDVKTAYEKMTPKVTVSATVDGGAAAKVGKAFADGVSDELNKKKFKVTINGDTATIETKAVGGLVRSGDIFVANENGRSEMIGRFGNNTAVANQEQMVEAMARGVSYAQAEQNSLLREQNRLLLGILQKEGTVNFGASSALGRTIRQSLNMYDSLVGG